MKRLFAIMLLAGAAVSVNAQKVQVGSDPNVDLSKYKTYSWGKGGGPNPIINQIIMAAVDDALKTKGMTKVDKDAQVTVVTWAATESDMHISHPSWTPAMGSISTGIVVGSSAWPVTKGTLVVDILDAGTKDSVWRGTATDTLKQGPSGNAAKDAKSVEKPIKKAVDKMFKLYPKRSGNNP
jgi:hypothetical protein